MFGLGRDSALKQSHQIASVDPYLYKEEPLTPTQHGQYVPIPEQFETWAQDLMNLPQQVAYVKLQNEPPVKVKTLAVREPSPDNGELREVLAAYAAHYQRTQHEAEAATAQLGIGPDTAPGNGSYQLFAAHEETEAKSRSN